ncbi:MAG TPA: tetratricopeptide repeat protein, partial [Thermoanaerobaculia bacterium]|nr:tetratricopeptide repeat protein [Thermoanaerobaculia bacterium]
MPITVILGVALVLRLAHWVAVRRAPFIGAPVMDSWEYDRWAREIAGGDWLGRGRGVFFQAPLYPYLLAILYKLVGPRLDAAYLAQIGLAVAGCYALYRAGRTMAGEQAGLAAAALAAVYGPFLFYDVQLLKESLAVTAVCFLLWAMAWAAAGAGLETARARPEAATGGPEAATPAAAAATVPTEAPAGARRGAAGRWLLVGLLLGILALLRENALLVVPFLVPLAWSGGRLGAAGSGPGPRAALARRARRAGRAAAFLAGVALALAPVALRNGLVGGDFLLTTSQGGVNFFIGNNPRADGTYRPIVPGKQIPELEQREPARIAEQVLGRPVTPAGVSRFWLHRALGWARSHPGDFLRLTMRKLGLFWSWYEWPDAVDYYYLRGLSPVYRLPLLEFGGVTLLAALGLGFLGGGRGRRLAPALVFAGAWMVSTVAFFLFARYRLPAVPALLLLAALPVAALAEAVSAWRRERTAATAPHSTASHAASSEEEAPDLGRTAVHRRSRPADSAMRAAGLALAVAAAFAVPRLVAFEPRLDLVHYNLGRLAEERGDPALAGRHYQAALAAAPDTFLAWLDLGNLAARRRDWPEALRCYQRAAALEPDSDDAQSNLGGIYLALGDLAASSRHLERALALNPRSLQALQNSALLRLRLGDLAA